MQKQARRTSDVHPAGIVHSVQLTTMQGPCGRMTRPVVEGFQERRSVSQDVAFSGAFCRGRLWVSFSFVQRTNIITDRHGRIQHARRSKKRKKVAIKNETTLSTRCSSFRRRSTTRRRWYLHLVPDASNGMRFEVLYRCTFPIIVISFAIGQHVAGQIHKNISSAYYCESPD